MNSTYIQPNKVLVLGFLLLTKLLFAQTDFRPGFIITGNGDSVGGKIDYRSDFLMSTVCTFKSSDNAVTDYSPYDLAGYRFTESKYYVSKEVKGKKHFLEYLIKGKISVFYNRDKEGDHYYIEKEREQIIELPYVKEVRVVKGRQVFYESTKHIGILNYYMRDAPSLKSSIETIPEPSHKNLIRLAQEYHHTVCKEEECIVYEKRKSIVHILAEGYVGAAKFKSLNTILNEVGASIYLSIPRTNERVFFKTGLIYDFSPKREDSIRTYRIPLHLQYIYRVHRIQPKVSGGVNLLYLIVKDFSGRFYFLSFNVGLDYKITNKLALTSSFNTDNIPFGFKVTDIPTLQPLYSINVGLRWDLK